jgi:hypothetical protein
MDVQNFLAKILAGAKETGIPKVVKQAFSNTFNAPVNTEWNQAGDAWEAIFYQDEMEHLARFQPNGELLSLKINLPLTQVPRDIQKAAQSQGELMNAIIIKNQDAVKYQLIVRNENLERYFLLLNSKGEVLEKEKL